MGPAIAGGSKEDLEPRMKKQARDDEAVVMSGCVGLRLYYLVNLSTSTSVIGWC